MTLIEMVTDILSDMDSDVVTSYLDTVESEQVAQILKTTYFNMIDGRDWPHLYQPFRLTESSATTPTHMTFGNTVMNVDYVKYNIRTATDTKDRYIEIKFMEPKAFMGMLDARDSSATNVDQTTDASGILLNIYNDRAPSYYTSFDEETVIFDSYDIGVDTYLTTAKNQCYGKIYPTVTLSDSFYFDLPTEAFSWLLSEAKATCALTLKQSQNPKAEQVAVTQRRRMSQEAWKIRNGITYPDYGRRSKK